MALIHRQDQLSNDLVALECHACGHRHPAAEFCLLDDPLRCPECGTGGLIPRTGSQASERFPAVIAGRWTPIPEALMDHASDLGLGPHEILVVIALERHRRAMGDEVFPSRDRIAALTGLSVATVKRAIVALVDAHLVGRRQVHFKDSGRKTNNRYDLDPLWEKLAGLETGQQPRVTQTHGEDINGEIPPTAGHTDPRTAGQDDDSPRVTQTQEVDVEEREPEEEADPEGASPAAPDLTAAGFNDQNDVDDVQIDPATTAAWQDWQTHHPDVAIFQSWLQFKAEQNGSNEVVA